MYNNDSDMTSGFNSERRDYMRKSGEANEDRIINKDSRDPFRYEKNIQYDDYYRYNLTTDQSEHLRTPLSNVHLNFNYDEGKVNNSITSTGSNMYKRRVGTPDDELLADFSDILKNRQRNREVKSRDTNSTISTELSYYKNMIDNMQGEISKLNTKLNDLEVRNNNGTVVGSGVSRGNTDRGYIGNTLKNAPVKRELTRTASLKDYGRTISKEKVKTISSRGTSSEKKIVKKTTTKSKSRSKTPNKTKIQTAKRTPTQEPFSENEQLRIHIKKLEERIKYLTEQLHFDKVEKKGKDHLRVELEIWKNRADSLSHSYIDTLNDLRKQLASDKSRYTEEIKSAQTTFVNQVMSLKTGYQSVIEKNENTIKKLRRENEDLRKKVTKVKDILVKDK
jgi:hypothetical protein